MSAGLTRVKRVERVTQSPRPVDGERWDGERISLLPAEAKAAMRGKPFNSKFRRHPHPLQTQFRPLEELVTTFAEDVDITGRKSNHLTAVRFSHVVPINDKNKSGVVHYDVWFVKCDCGNERTLNGNKIREGRQASCSRSCPLKTRRG